MTATEAQLLEGAAIEALGAAMDAAIGTAIGPLAVRPRHYAAAVWVRLCELPDAAAALRRALEACRDDLPRVRCRAYVQHQLHHRQVGRHQWVCDLCEPQEDARP